MSGSNYLGYGLPRIIDQRSLLGAFLPGGPPDWSSRYNTQLTPGEEGQFQQWLRHLSQAKGYDASQDLQDYDLRGAWKANAEAAANGHLPDTWKKPNHPTFSTGSQYSGQDGYVGGAWQQQPGGAWSYRASPTNMQLFGAQALRDYFARREAGNELVMPQ